jgi:hypothetical protein
LVDTQTDIPSGRGYFRGFGLGQPALLADRSVFFGTGYQGQAGIYQASDQGLQRVANNGPSLPHGTHRFANFGSSPILDGDRILFLGQAPQAQLQICQAHQAALKTLVATERPLPTQRDYFINLSNPVANDGHIAFLGRLAAQQQKSIFKYDGEVLRLIACQSKTDAKTSLVDLSMPAIDGSGQVAFRGRNHQCQLGLYHYAYNQLQLIATTQTPIPRGQGAFRCFSDPLIDQGIVTFCGWGRLFQQGIYQIGPAGIQPVVDTQTRIPDSLETFARFYTVTVHGANLAFIAGDSHGRLGIFAELDGALLKVIEVEDKLDDKPIAGLFLGRQALHGRSLVFRARFRDGSEDIFRADL